MDAYLKVSLSSELSNYWIIRACYYAIYLKFYSYLIFYCEILSTEGILDPLFYYLFFLAIYSRKFFNLFDSYFNRFRFSYSFFTSPTVPYFYFNSYLLLNPFLTVPSYSSEKLWRFGLQKEVDFLRIDLSWGWGRLNWIELTISAMSFQRGLEMDAIQERLNALMILMISFKLASLLFFRYSFTYYSRHADIILKSCNFYFTFSPKSTEERFLFVAVELAFPYTFFPRLITLMVCLARFIFFCYPPPTLCALALEVEWTRLTEGALEMGQFLNMADDYFSSVLMR